MNPASLAREALLDVTRGEPARQSRSRGVESAVDTWSSQSGIALSDREVRGERAPTRRSVLEQSFWSGALGTRRTG
jgi:hypothetical protein